MKSSETGEGGRFELSCRGKFNRRLIYGQRERSTKLPGDFLLG